MMNRVLILATTLMASAASAALFPASAADPIKIGVPIGLSGANSVVAPSVVQSAQLAVAEINAGGGVIGRQLELDVADDQSGAAGAQKAFDMLIFQKKVDALISMETSAARNAGLRSNQAMPPNGTVVCDLDQVVDLGALADDGVSGRAAVDGRIGADLHVVLDDDAPHLRNLLMSLRARQIAEAVLADTDTRMNDHAIADQRMLDRRTGADRTVAADAHTRPDHRAGRDHRAGADLGMGTDDGQRIDRHIRFKACRRMHVRVLAASFYAEQR